MSRFVPESRGMCTAPRPTLILKDLVSPGLPLQCLGGDERRRFGILFEVS